MAANAPNLERPGIPPDSLTPLILINVRAPQKRRVPIFNSVGSRCDTIATTNCVNGKTKITCSVVVADN